MTQSSNLRVLRYVLLFLGVFLVGPFPFIVFLWPSGWRWHPYNIMYEHMLIGIYMTLGLFLLLAARNPQRHRSLLWFTVLSSLVHGGIMEAYALMDAQERGHLFGDATFTFGSALILGFALRRFDKSRR